MPLVGREHAEAEVHHSTTVAAQSGCTKPDHDAVDRQPPWIGAVAPKPAAPLVMALVALGLYLDALVRSPHLRAGRPRSRSTSSLSSASTNALAAATHRSTQAARRSCSRALRSALLSRSRFLCLPRPPTCATFLAIRRSSFGQSAHSSLQDDRLILTPKLTQYSVHYRLVSGYSGCVDASSRPCTLAPFGAGTIPPAGLPWPGATWLEANEEVRRRGRPLRGPRRHGVISGILLWIQAHWVELHICSLEPGHESGRT